MGDRRLSGQLFLITREDEGGETVVYAAAHEERRDAVLLELLLADSGTYRTDVVVLDDRAVVNALINAARDDREAERAEARGG